jgi:hypothetical protein
MRYYCVELEFERYNVKPSAYLQGSLAAFMVANPSGDFSGEANLVIGLF